MNYLTNGIKGESPNTKVEFIKNLIKIYEIDQKNQKMTISNLSTDETKEDIKIDRQFCEEKLLEMEMEDSVLARSLDMKEKIEEEKHRLELEKIILE